MKIQEVTSITSQRDIVSQDTKEISMQMSSIHPFSQAGFWDFVASVKERNNAESQAMTPDSDRAIGRPRGGRRGFGRRAQNASEVANEPATPLTPNESTPYDSATDENEKDLPPQYPSVTHPAEAVAITSENEKMAADAMPPNGGNWRGPGRRGGRGQGKGPRGEGAGGRRMRRALFEDGNGPSEEEKAARAERRRLRREANGKGIGPGPRARRMRKALAEGQTLTDENGETIKGENSQQQQQCRGGPRGLRHRRNAEAPGPRSLQPGSENLVDVSSTDEENIGRKGRRGCLRGRGAGGMKEARRLRFEGFQGGPRKFAAQFEQGANPSNGNMGNGRRGQGMGPRARKMAAFHQQAESQSQPMEFPNGGLNKANLPLRPRAMRQEMRERARNEKQAASVHFGPEVSGDTTVGKRQMNKQNKKHGAKKLNRTLNGVGGKRNQKFKPRADIYNTEGSYIVHLPVPGATQKDVGVMWDTDKGVLRIAGIVQRPSPQQISSEAVLTRAQRPVGSFNRVVKFGKKNQKVKVYENGITAILEDGILKVEVPKYDGDETTSDTEYVEVKPAY